ncbi:MAG: CHASE domain-containing protein [Thiotrichaceae bacterium]|nr:CHASE domain-containing protein [Thiotrichaceae bacterium]
MMNIAAWSPVLRQRLPAALVLLSALTCTLFMWHIAMNNINHANHAEFNLRAERFKVALDEKIQAYSYVLHAFRPLFLQSDALDFTHWQSYANLLRYREYYPEMHTVGFTKRIMAENYQAFSTEMQAKVQPNFMIHPEGVREFYQPVTFVDPFDERAKRSIGFDLWSEPIRRATMETARDTGKTAISHKITLLHSTEQYNNISGFLMFVPIYKNGELPETLEQRRSKLLGFIFSPFSVPQLIGDLRSEDDDLRNGDNVDIGLEIYDGNKTDLNSLMYQDTTSKANYVPQFETELRLNLGQHFWTLRFNTLPEFDQTFQNNVPQLILVSGTLVSLLLSILTLSLTHSRNTLLQKQSIEQALLKSEERFDLAMRGANDGLWDWDVNSSKMYCSPRFNEMLGLPVDQLLSIRDWSALIHPGDVDKAWKDMHAYLDRHCSYYRNLHRMRHHDGHYVWCLSRGTAVWDHEGHPQRVVGTYTDVSQQKAVEEALRHSEERFELAMRGANDGLWDWNIETHNVYYSPRFKQILGLAPEQKLSLESFNALVNPEDRAFIQKSTRDYFAKRLAHYEMRYRVQHQQGHLIWLLSRGIAVWNEAGKAVRMIGTVVDITHTKQVEEELRLSKEAAEHANQAKSIFLANMSHELRTPLNAILGYTQILAWDESLNEQQVEGVNIIRRSGEYLLTLINDILDLSKIEAGRIDLNINAFNFNEFIQGVVDLFKMRAQQKNLAFLYEPLTPMPVGVEGDERRLRQVLINLLGNALKFTKEGGVVLKISYEMPYIRFQIEDTGIGIAEEDINKIFLPFQQVGDQNYRAEGTGLGLSITQRLVNMMNGELQVHSKLGQGSQFIVSLALPVAKALLTHIPEQKPLIIGFEGEPRKILLIDDKWENRSILRNLLTQLGFETLEAEQGALGVEIARETLPDLIITDLVMPVMDGFEATRQLRKIPALAQTPIIAASASVFDYHQQQSRNAGCDDFIPKPIRADILLELLQTHLHLEWKYAAAIAPQAGTQQLEQQSDTELITRLDEEQIEKLVELSKLGDIQAILEYTSSYAHAPEASCIQKIRSLAKNFDLAGIDTLLQQITPH